jgi:hypothetical protein
VYVCVGKVRASESPTRDSPDLVIDVAELVWEPIPRLAVLVSDPRSSRLGCGPVETLLVPKPSVVTVLAV